MGDRGNIRLLYGEEKRPIYFYTHWSGSDLDSIVRNALAREERWDDPSYLGRIIFCELVKGQEDGTTGFGIDVEIGDGGDQIVTVDMERQTVRGLRGPEQTFAQFARVSGPCSGAPPCPTHGDSGDC